MPAKPYLGKRASICGILKLDWKPGSLFEGRLEVEFAPAQVWGEYKALRTKINPAGQAYANAFVRDLGPHSGHIANATAQFVNKLVRVTPRRQCLLGDEMRIEIRESDYGTGRTNVDTD